jgi:hypothetical protein
MSAHTPESEEARTRRKFIAGAVVGGATVGAMWTTSLTLLARGRHPQIFVVGNDDWQILLIEHRTARVLLLSGDFEQPLGTEIDHLLGLLRQHIDVIIGTQASLDRLPPGLRSRRSVSTTVALDGSASSGTSRSFVPLTDSLLVGAGAFSITVRRLPLEEWTAARSAPPSWICQIAVGNLDVAIGPTLEILGENAHPTTALAIAPSGDLGSIIRLVPAAAIATNARSAEKALFSTGADGSDRTTWLIRTFPTEIAGFVVRNGRMQLPDWSQEIEIRNAVD